MNEWNNRIPHISYYTKQTDSFKTRSRRKNN
uniref:Uncharacterized protein n=1 Tax=Arundo donax TaxID=35708 RepID=A0A0A9FUR3_ARUDO